MAAIPNVGVSSSDPRICSPRSNCRWLWKNSKYWRTTALFSAVDMCALLPGLELAVATNEILTPAAHDDTLLASQEQGLHGFGKSRRPNLKHDVKGHQRTFGAGQAPFTSPCGYGGPCLSAVARRRASGTCSPRRGDRRCCKSFAAVARRPRRPRRQRGID